MTPQQRGEMAFGKRHLNLDMLQWVPMRVFDTNRKASGAPVGDGRWDRSGSAQ